MSRMHRIDQRLSTLPQRGKRIVYFITEDREILDEVFAGAGATLRALGGRAFDGGCAADDRLCAYARQNRLLADVYTVKELAGKLGSKILLPAGGAKEDPLDAHVLQRAPFFFLNDFHVLDKDTAAHFVKQFLEFAAARAQDGGAPYMFLISPIPCAPVGFEREMEIIDVPEMDAEDVNALLVRLAVRERFPSSLQSAQALAQKLTDMERGRLRRAAADFKGLPRGDILEIASDLRSEFGSFFGWQDGLSGTMENVAALQKARVRLVKECKVRAAEHDKTVTMLEPSMAVSGLEEYRNWLGEIRSDLLDPDAARRWGCLPPKGVLLTGVPGSGKTQAAKLTAAEIGTSLVQFRMDNLLGGLVGDSESNFKRCRKRIEALAPCVVLFDEMEKIFGASSSSGSHEVRMNLLAALLDWLQENKLPIFFFATCNSVSDLRPELLRDGRFDMRFYVFMPTRSELVSIIRFHLARANGLSGGALFAGFQGQYDELAGEFLDEIAAYGARTGKNMLYTGANVENLIGQTNRLLRRTRGEPEGITRREYLDAMLRTATSGRSQPYGVTNLGDIAAFWLSARRNQDANAGGRELLPFVRFVERDKEGKAVVRDLPAAGNAYDEMLQKGVAREICRLVSEGRRA